MGSSGLHPKRKSIKQLLTTDEIRSIVDRYLEFWDDGHRPHIYSSYEEELVAKVRKARNDERYPPDA